MTNELNFPDPSDRNSADRDALTEPAIQLIRDVYMPPASAAESAAYWSSLERRIMARVVTSGNAQADGRFWSVFDGWARAGLAAAVAIFAVAGFVNQRLPELEPQYAYETVMAPTPEALAGPADLILATDRSAQSDAALRYVLSH